MGRAVAAGSNAGWGFRAVGRSPHHRIPVLIRSRIGCYCWLCAAEDWSIRVRIVCMSLNELELIIRCESLHIHVTLRGECLNITGIRGMESISGKYRRVITIFRFLYVLPLSIVYYQPILLATTITLCCMASFIEFIRTQRCGKR